MSIDVTDWNFEDRVIKPSKKQPVLVDFWAPWCGPCRMLGPVLDQVAGEFAGRFTLAKVNVDENPETAQKYGVMSIPAVRLFKNGKVAAEFVGARPAAELKRWLEENL